MRRFVPVFAIVVASTAFGCSSAPPGEDVGSTSSAETAGGGGELVTLTGFNRDTLVLTAVTVDGLVVSLQYGADTSALPASLGAYEPPDPCLGQAHAWNHQIDQGLTQAVIERLSHFAQFQCDARVSVGAGGQVLSFRPAPTPPNPI